MRKFLAFLLALVALSAFGQTPVIGTPPTHVAPSYAMPPAKFFINPLTFLAPQFGSPTNTIAMICTGTVAGCSPFTTPAAAGGGGGAFRINCNNSHMAYDDPIVWPGQPGKTHPHIFFGNTSTSYASVLDNQANIGRSTCDGGIANRTGYWVPILVYSCPQPALTGCDGTRDGEAQIPKSAANGTNLVYYKGGGNPLLPSEAAWTWPVPKLRMIAGNSTATALQSGGVVSASCYTATTGTAGDDGVFGFYGRIPTTYEASQFDNCDELEFVVIFPQCESDTLDVDSPDHQSHMRYWTANTVGDPTHGACDTTGFTVPIPHITFNIHYRPTTLADLNYWRVSSDPPEQYGVTLTSADASHIKLASSEPATADWYKHGVVFIGGVGRHITTYDGTTKIATVNPAFGSTPAAGTAYAVRQPGGLTFHGDWANGWDQTNPVPNTGGQTVTDILLNHCIRASRNCGTDALGDQNPSFPRDTSNTQWFFMTSGRPPG